MLLIALCLVVVVAIAVLVAVYVAYPDRGESIPYAEWLSDAMVRVRDKIQP